MTREHITPAPAFRITELDGLRGVAIALVFIHHAYNVRLLWFGVDIFFVLSGFLITRILLRQKEKSFPQYIGRFYSHRARRILPPYILILILVACIDPGPWMRYWYFYLGGMNFIIPLHLDFSGVLSGLWSLAVEEQFYLLWPLAVFFLSRKHIISLSIIIILLAPVLRFVFTPAFNSSYSIYMLLPFRMDTLGMGALIGLLWPAKMDLGKDKVRNATQLKWLTLGVLLLSLGVIYLLTIHGYTTRGNTAINNACLYEGTLGLATSALGFALLGVGKGFLNLRILIFLGMISYSFYLIHLVAFVAFPQVHGLVALALSLIYSTASWFFIEKPILGWASRGERVR